MNPPRHKLIFPRNTDAGGDTLIAKRILISSGARKLDAEIVKPAEPLGWLVILQAEHERTALLQADTLGRLNQYGLGTLTMSVPLTRKQVRGAAESLLSAAAWLRAQPEVRGLPLVYFGAGRGTGSVLLAAARTGEDVAGVMSWNGRPARAWRQLGRITAPTLLMTGSHQPWSVWWANWLARWAMGSVAELETVNALQPDVAQLVAWFNARIVNPRHAQNKATYRVPVWLQKSVAVGAVVAALGVSLSSNVPNALAANALRTASRSTALVSSRADVGQADEQFADAIKVNAVQVRGDGFGKNTLPARVSQPRVSSNPEFADSIYLGGNHVRGDGIQAKDKKRRRALAPQGTGSQQLDDAAGVKYFVNTDITFSTSSSASGAMSEASFTHTVTATTSGGGTVQSKLEDAYDGYNGLCISLNGTTDACETGDPNFDIYYKNGPATVEGNGRQIDFPSQVIGDLTVSRKVFVPSNDEFARWLNIVTNNGTTAQDVVVNIANNFGSDDDTVITDTSSGDKTVDTSDTWVTTFQNYSGNTSNDPRLGHVLQGPGAEIGLAAVYFADGDDNPWWSYRFTLQPGQTGIIMNFGVVQASKAASAAKSAELVGLPDNALQYMSDTEKNEVLNFRVPCFVSSPQLLTPTNASKSTGVGVAFSWQADQCKDTTYKVVMKRDSTKGTVVLKQNGLTQPQFTQTLPSPRGNTIYYWHVQACNEAGCKWSKWNTFLVLPQSAWNNGAPIMIPIYVAMR